jgi:hypothetical protein
MVKCSKAEVRRLRTALRWKLPSTQRERIQMVLLREGGMTQPAISAAMGVSLSTVNRAHMAYDHGGIKALKPKANGGRKRENMTVAEEKTLLAGFAHAAGAGELLNIRLGFSPASRDRLFRCCTTPIRLTTHCPSFELGGPEQPRRGCGVSFHQQRTNRRPSPIPVSNCSKQ